MTPHPKTVCIVWAACVLVAACASDAVIKDSRQMLAEGRGGEALALLEKATRENPQNHPYRSEYFRQRELAVAQWLAQGDSLRLAGQFDAAEALYRQALKFDVANPRATLGLAQIETDTRHRALVAEADKLVKAEKYRDARDVLAPVLAENPAQRDARRLQRLIEEKTMKPAIASLQLRSSISKPISLELKDVPLRTVFDVLARAANLNFLFDKDVRADQKTTIVVRDAQVEDVIRLILATNQLEQKVLTESTALIYPNTPQKLREYQDLVVKSFYIANADVKQTANLIRTILKTRDIFIDEKLNLLVIKDTPNAIRLAEKLIAAQDLAEPEVMLEVEVLEVSYNRLQELGARFPGSLGVSVVGGSASTTTGATASGGTPGVLTLPELRSRSANLVRLTFTDPLFLFSLRQTDGRTNLLANPRIRVKNKEKAKIHIGERVPVITTSAAVTGGFLSQSVSYLDVGLQLEVEPLIYLEDDVGIKLGLEVSSITNIIESTSSGGGSTRTYQVGTRKANTVLRLHDGETQILAGLISDEDRRSANRVPGIGDFPVLGRLFSSTSDSTLKTEIVLLITPRLMRTLARPDARTVEFAAGTEASAGGGPLGGPAFSPAPPPGQPAPIPPGFRGPTPDAPGGPIAPPVPGSTLVPFGGVQGEPPRSE